MSKTVELTDATIGILIGVQRQLMRDWSEAWWAAQWLDGIEYKAWDGSAYSREMSAWDPDVVAIHEVSRITGVWCEYETDVPLDEWEQRHGPPRTRMADAVPTEEQMAAMNRSHERQLQHYKDIGLT